MATIISNDNGKSYLDWTTFEPMVKEALLELDLDNSGRLSMTELREAMKLFRDMRAGQGGINYTHLPKDAQEVLSQFDEDKSGTVDTSELAIAAKLYEASKKQTKRLTKVVMGLSILLILLVAAISAMTFVVVELTKETRAGSDGVMTVAGTETPVKVENPGFKTGSADAAKNAGAAAEARRRLLGATGGGGASNALVDSSGAAIATSALTQDDGTQVDSKGSVVSTQEKTFTDYFPNGLVDLLNVEKRSYIDSLTSIQETDENGLSLTLGITGHDFRDFHLVRSAEAGGLVIAPAGTDAANYDVAMHALLLRTSHPRFTGIVAVTVEPLNDAESALTPSYNMSRVVKSDEMADIEATVYEAAGFVASADSSGRRLLYHQYSLPHWLLNNGQVRNVVNQVDQWKVQAKEAKDQVTGVIAKLQGITQNLKWALNDATKLPQKLMDDIHAKVAPVQELDGCDIIKAMVNEVNKFLAAKKTCVGPGCSGSHLNSGMIEQLHSDDYLSVEGKTDLTICFQLYGLELDCTGMNKALKEFWAENPLQQSLDDAIQNNQMLKNLQGNLNKAKGVVDAVVGRHRRLLSEADIEEMRAAAAEEATQGLDIDAVVDAVHKDTVAEVGKRLAAFMKRRNLAANADEILKVKALRGRTTVDIASELYVDFEGDYEWEKDLMEDVELSAFEQVIAIPGTMGLVTAEVEAELDLNVPIKVGLEADATADVYLKLNKMTVDNNFLDKNDMKVKTGNTDGSNIQLKGGVTAHGAVHVHAHNTVQAKICFAGVCAGIAMESYFDAGAGFDGALTTTTGDTFDGCKEWTMDAKYSKYAKYTEDNKKLYNDAIANANGGLVLGGGAWLYATYPYFKIYPVFEAAVAGDCALAADNIYEFKPDQSLRDDTASAERYPHPYGKYLIRTAIGFGKNLGPQQEVVGVQPIVLPEFNLPASWDGVLPPLNPGASGRRLLTDIQSSSSSGEVAAPALQCTDYNGGHPTELRGSVPSRKARCGGRMVDIEGAAKELCYHADCCHGHAVKMSWARVVCVPGELARTIPDNHKLL